MSPLALPASTASHSHRRCPQCGEHVKRVLRSANDKRRWDAEQWRRFRCRADTCTWTGLLAVPQRRRSRLEAGFSLQGVRRVGLYALLMLMAAGLTWGCITALQLMMES